MLTVPGFDAQNHLVICIYHRTNKFSLTHVNEGPGRSPSSLVSDAESDIALGCFHDYMPKHVCVFVHHSLWPSLYLMYI